MIQKLFDLKELQIEQHLLLRQQFVSKQSDLKENIALLQVEINTRSVELLGAIRDFQMLEMHKQSLKELIRQMNKEVQMCEEQIQIQNQMIATLMHEKEQFKYILDTQKNEKIKKTLKDFEEQSSELIQYRYIHG